MVRSMMYITFAVLSGMFLQPLAGQEVIEARNDQYKMSHPNQYHSWTQTQESSELTDALKNYPAMVILWAGYPFSKDYKQARGHFYSIVDVRQSLRTAAPMTEEDGPLPMACWSCKGPDVARVIQSEGEDAYFKGKWARGGAMIVNPVGCADCHNTNTQAFKKGDAELMLSRPYAIRAMTVINQPFKDANTLDKQAQVCAQCHVEYYFDAKKNNAVTFPWAKGTTPEAMEAYYDDIEFSDWTHGLSKTPMLKAQHPEFETWRAGIHGRNNVTCVDCHMPKLTDAQGNTYTDHKIGNPFDKFESVCTSCHDQSKVFFEQIVAERRAQIHDIRSRVEKQLVHAHFEAKAALDAGATQEEMKAIHQDIRHAQWRWDYAVASHGIHMHAPDVALRSLATALDKAANARTKLARLLATKGITTEITLPDISTKEKAQAVVGWNMEQLRQEKDTFLNTIVPGWEEKAKAENLLSK